MPVNQISEHHWQEETFIPSDRGLCRLVAEGKTPEQAKQRMRELVETVKRERGWT